MNQQLTATGNRILGVSRRLPRAPRSAPVPRAFASLLTDPVDLMEEAWKLRPSDSDAEPVFSDEPISNYDVSSPVPHIQRRRNVFAQPSNFTLSKSGLAPLSENVSPTTLREAAFWKTSERDPGGEFRASGRYGERERHDTPSTSDLEGPRSLTLPAPNRFASSTLDPSHAKGDLSAKRTTKATPEPSHFKDVTRLTRSSARLTAVLNANLRKQTEQELRPESASTLASLPLAPQPLSLDHPAASPPGPIASAKVGSLQSPVPKRQADHRLPLSTSDITPAKPLTETQTTTVQSLTVEAVLEELYERLRVEFLRTYGSSGG
jgi:hypothetical protein